MLERAGLVGLRFHDLRHSYATWLVTGGAPINDVQTVMGHEKASTTLNLYTHQAKGRDGRLLDILDGPAASSLPDSGERDADQEPRGEGATP